MPPYGAAHAAPLLDVGFQHEDDLTVTHLSKESWELCCPGGTTQKGCLGHHFVFRGKIQKYVLKDKKGGHDTAQYLECFTMDL